MSIVTEHGESAEQVFDSPFQAIMDMFVMSLGDVIIIYDELSKSPNPNVAKVGLLIQPKSILITIVLIILQGI